MEKITSELHSQACSFSLKAIEEIMLKAANATLICSRDKTHGQQTLDKLKTLWMANLKNGGGLTIEQPSTLERKRKLEEDHIISSFLTDKVAHIGPIQGIIAAPLEYMAPPNVTSFKPSGILRSAKIKSEQLSAWPKYLPKPTVTAQDATLQQPAANPICALPRAMQTDLILGMKVLVRINNKSTTDNSSSSSPLPPEYIWWPARIIHISSDVKAREKRRRSTDITSRSTQQNRMGYSHIRVRMTGNKYGGELQFPWPSEHVIIPYYDTTTSEALLNDAISSLQAVTSNVLNTAAGENYDDNISGTCSSSSNVSQKMPATGTAPSHNMVDALSQLLMDLDNDNISDDIHSINHMYDMTSTSNTISASSNQQQQQQPVLRLANPKDTLRSQSQDSQYSNGESSLFHQELSDLVKDFDLGVFHDYDISGDALQHKPHGSNTSQHQRISSSDQNNNNNNDEVDDILRDLFNVDNILEPAPAVTNNHSTSLAVDITTDSTTNDVEPTDAQEGKPHPKLEHLATGERVTATQVYQAHSYADKMVSSKPNFELVPYQRNSSAAKLSSSRSRGITNFVTQSVSSSSTSSSSSRNDVDNTVGNNVVLDRFEDPSIALPEPDMTVIGRLKKISKTLTDEYTFTLYDVYIRERRTDAQGKTYMYDYIVPVVTSRVDISELFINDRDELRLQRKLHGL